MPAPKEILELVERYQRNRQEYESGKYNEAQLRQEFLNPFFKALGWDVTNEKGYSEAYKEVIHEDAIKIGAATKAPDYCFRIGGTRKFFVEAKKPSVNIKDDLSPAFQLRRYAWSAKLPLSILSDFEEFAIYDCRIKPNKADKPTTGRTLYFTFEQYDEKWDEIASVFSQDAVLKGSFDKYADSGKNRKGTTTVDEAFLEEIEKWRKELAKNIASKNSKLTIQELNFSVQKIIDRIIFLRICEDRGIEPYGKLLALVNGTKVYDRLTQVFQRADERFNSGLFHFQKEKDRPEQPDELTLNLKIDDKIFKDMIGGLYYPESPYEFSALPADILGQVYEQFLGKVIRLTEGHQAKVEDKPEVKKAGGVFYTPTYIVEYIVQNTVGKLCEGKTPKQVAKLTILDPACGSGSFLIGAYQYLLDWHRDWYVKDKPENHQKELYQGSGGDWRLTTDTRKRILLNNIYGVDIDPQAVEVTKLSLLLKVLEGESDQTLKKQLEIFHQRALPDLGSNIKCGNSLVGSDYFSGELLTDEIEIRRINSFDWDKEFNGVFQGGGFDCIIGNPPYVRQEMLVLIKEYLSRKYQTFQSAADLYVYFIERGISLLKENGILGIIVANKWMRASYGSTLRKWIKTLRIDEIVDFGDLPVFSKASTYPCILRIAKAKPSDSFFVTKAETLKFLNLQQYVDSKKFSVKQSNLLDEGWMLGEESSRRVIEKIKRNGIALEKYANNKMFYGVKTGLNEAFVIDEKIRSEIIKESPKSVDLIKPFLTGRDVNRYGTFKEKLFLILIPSGWTNKNSGNTTDKWNWFLRIYPSLARHLVKYEQEAKKRYDQGDYWWELRPCEYYGEFEKPKIITPCIIKKASFSFDKKYFYSNDKTTIIGLEDFYLLGLLNSKVLDFFMRAISSTKRGGYYECKPMYMAQLPIKEINGKNSVEKESQNQIIALVQKVIFLNQNYEKSKNPSDAEIFKRQINEAENQINNLVYSLYGLSRDEIEIVEAENVR